MSFLSVGIRNFSVEIIAWLKSFFFCHYLRTVLISKLLVEGFFRLNTAEPAVGASVYTKLNLGVNSYKSFLDLLPSSFLHPSFF